MEDGSVKYNQKIPLGYKDQETYFIYNHMEMFIRMRPMANREETYQVVGFEILPKSIHHLKLQKAQKDAHKIDVRSKENIGEYLMHDHDKHDDLTVEP